MSGPPFSVSAVPSGLSPARTYEHVSESLGRLQAVASAIFARISDQIQGENARVGELQRRIDAVAERVARAAEDGTVLVLTPRLLLEEKGDRDALAYPLLFPQSAVDVALRQPFRFEEAQSLHHKAQKEAGRGEGGEAEESGPESTLGEDVHKHRGHEGLSVPAVFQPHSGTGMRGSRGEEAVPQLLSFFLEAGFSRSPQMVVHKQDELRDQAHAELHEETSPPVVRAPHPAAMPLRSYLLNDSRAGGAPREVDEGNEEVEEDEGKPVCMMSSAELDALLEEASKFRYVPSLAPLPLLNKPQGKT